ncbi:hypothetical protein V6N13_059033 [Hibiscus sabdariffa]|uniref:EF-hand domain-containing protein n=1 Tax=Hibiscus sabdariffa TaxID=183260 RepID=A0ABR2GEB2_9ROSI
MFCFRDSSKGIPSSCQRKRGGPVPVNEAQLKAIFKQCDINRDGRLSKQELKNFFTLLGSHLPGWRAGRVLRHADGNEDGYVSEDELDGLVKYALRCGYTHIVK